jgi:hypothetical protein
MADLRLAIPSGTEETQAYAPVFDLQLLTSNPMRGKDCISFNLSDLTRIRLSIYDLSGRSISTLDNGLFEVGTHRVSWQHGLRNRVYFTCK